MNIEKIVEKQNEFYRSGMTRTYAFRKSMLDRLENGMDKYEDRIFRNQAWYVIGVPAINGYGYGWTLFDF